MVVEKKLQVHYGLAAMITIITPTPTAYPNKQKKTQLLRSFSQNVLSAVVKH